MSGSRSAAVAADPEVPSGADGADAGGERGAVVTAIVPSLRVDVLGARAFKVSRAYFAKGVAAGRVSVAGAVAGKSTTADVGEVVVARGLGSFSVLTVDGLTRKGNVKVTVRVSRDRD